VAFKRLKNFATVVAQKNRLVLYLHLNPKDLEPLYSPKKSIQTDIRMTSSKGNESFLNKYWACTTIGEAE